MRERRCWANERNAIRLVVLVTALSLTGGGIAACSKDRPTRAEARDRSAKKRTVLATEYDDVRLGNAAAKEIEAELGLYDSPELTAYVGEIGRRLVAYAPLRPFEYEFLVVDQMAPNAFSIPGGHIYVSRGLITLANSEDELANVIGHEIIHAAERHIAAQQELARRSNPFTLPFLRMAKLAAYSRDHERAADKGGQEIAARAGYDPAALAAFLVHLGDVERLTVGYSRLSSYFDTHPGTTERIAATASRAMTISWERNALQPVLDRSAYLNEIRGVVLDADPREGIFRETEFIHPDLDFRILFPRGWELVNSHTAVGAVSPERGGQIILTAESAILPPEQQEDGADEWEALAPREPETLSAERAAARFLDKHGAEFHIRLQRSQAIQIGEIPAWRLDIEGRMGGTAVGGQITFIPHRQTMFRITAAAPSSLWSNYLGRARTTARTFRPLSEDERRSVEIVRLKVVKALEGEDIASLSHRTANAWDPGRTAVLNGVFVNARFTEGQEVKIARAAPYRARRSAESGP